MIICMHACSLGPQDINFIYRRSTILHLQLMGLCKTAVNYVAISHYPTSSMHAPTMSTRRYMLNLTTIFNILHAKIAFPSFPLMTKTTPYTNRCTNKTQFYIKKYFSLPFKLLQALLHLLFHLQAMKLFPIDTSTFKYHTLESNLSHASFCIVIYYVLCI